MAINEPTPATEPEDQPPNSREDSEIVLSDTVMGGVIRESVRRHVPVVQVVAERRGERPAPWNGNPPHEVTSSVPVQLSFWSRCRRWFRKH